jgi:hypothetical protein
MTDAWSESPIGSEARTLVCLVQLRVSLGAVAGRPWVTLFAPLDWMGDKAGCGTVRA